MRDIFANEDTEADLLIDTENAFNTISRKVMLHNLNFICPIITTYITNCYIAPARLFIIGGGEILSKVGTTQDDPTAMGTYALGILPLIHFLLEFISINHLSAKEVAFADDFTVAGKLTSIRDYWGKLTVLGPKYGYFAKASKSYLIIKEDKLGEARNIFNDSTVNITIEGKKHLGAVIGSNEYREEYGKDLVNDWNNQLVLLPSIAQSQPHAAYSAFVSDFKSKLNYFMKTIPGISQFLYPLEETVRSKFIPAISGGHLCSNNERQLLSLPTRYGGLAIPIFYELAETEFENRVKLGQNSHY